MSISKDIVHLLQNAADQQVALCGLMCSLGLAYEDTDGAVCMAPMYRNMDFTDIFSIIRKKINSMTVQGDLHVHGDYIEAGSSKTINNTFEKVEHYHEASSASLEVSEKENEKEQANEKEGNGNEELFKYIHPAVTEEKERIQIDKTVRNLVHLPMTNLCELLKEMQREKKLYIMSIQPQLAFEELHRMGMPGEEQSGYGYKNFTKYFC